MNDSAVGWVAAGAEKMLSPMVHEIAIVPLQDVCERNLSKAAACRIAMGLAPFLGQRAPLTLFADVERFPAWRSEERRIRQLCLLLP